MKSFSTRLLGLWLPVMVATAIRAQSYSIDWFTIDGGGGTSTGSVYSVSGTIGQPDASVPMTGGNYSLAGGFWPLYAVQIEGAPLLSITSTNHSAMVSWPSTSMSWILQQNADLNSTNWVTAPEAITDNGTLKFIILTSPVGHWFYRLSRP
jgi:hypothetical protein